MTNENEIKEEMAIDLRKPENLEELQKNLETQDLEVDFEQQVRVAAYYISKCGYSYNQLCWFLGEKILKRTYRLGTPLSIREMRKKAEEINHRGLSQDELCWLNGEMDILIKKYFDK